MKERRFQDAMDSLNRALPHAKKPEDELAVRARIAFILKKQGDFPRSLKEFEHCIQLAEETGDLQTKAKLLTELGNIRRATGRTKEALVYFEKALVLYKGVGSFRKRVPQRLGVKAEMAMAYLDLGDFYRALKLNRNSLILHFLAGNPDAMGAAFANEGRIFMRAGRYEWALLFYYAAGWFFTRRNDLRGLAIQTHNMGVCHTHLGNYKLANKAYCHGMKVSKENDFTDIEANIFGSLANLGLAQGDLEDAFVNAQMSVQMFHRIGHKEGEAKGWGILGEIAGKRSNLEEAIHSHRKALVIADSAGNLDSLKNLLLALFANMKEAGREEEFHRLAGSIFRKYPELKAQLPQAPAGGEDQKELE